MSGWSRAYEGLEEQTDAAGSGLYRYRYDMDGRTIRNHLLDADGTL